MRISEQLLVMEVKLKEEIKVLPPFSFPFFLGRTLPCTCSSNSSSVHLAYIYRVHKCNNNPLNAPCGHWAGKQMLDFTSKIEPTGGNLNKNSLLAHITHDEKRNNGTHKGHTCGCCEPTIVCNWASWKAVKSSKRKFGRHFCTSSAYLLNVGKDATVIDWMFIMLYWTLCTTCTTNDQPICNSALQRTNKSCSFTQPVAAYLHLDALKLS